MWLEQMGWAPLSNACRPRSESQKGEAGRFEKPQPRLFPLAPASSGPDRLSLLLSQASPPEQVNYLQGWGNLLFHPTRAPRHGSLATWILRMAKPESTASAGPRYGETGPIRGQWNG